MELNATSSAIGHLFMVDIFGSGLLVAIFVMVLIFALAVYSGASILEFGIIFLAPAILILAVYGPLPDYMGGIVLIGCGVITILGLWRVLSLSTT